MPGRTGGRAEREKENMKLKETLKGGGTHDKEVLSFNTRSKEGMTNRFFKLTSR